MFITFGAQNQYKNIKKIKTKPQKTSIIDFTALFFMIWLIMY